jgi:hypothetical protein
MLYEGRGRIVQIVQTERYRIISSLLSPFIVPLVPRGQLQMNYTYNTLTIVSVSKWRVVQYDRKTARRFERQGKDPIIDPVIAETPVPGRLEPPFNRPPSRVRWGMLALLFLISVITYVDRVNISVAAQ